MSLQIGLNKAKSTAFPTGTLQEFQKNSTVICICRQEELMSSEILKNSSRIPVEKKQMTAEFFILRLL